MNEGKHWTRNVRGGAPNYLSTHLHEKLAWARSDKKMNDEREQATQLPPSIKQHERGPALDAERKKQW